MNLLLSPYKNISIPQKIQSYRKMFICQKDADYIINNVLDNKIKNVKKISNSQNPQMNFCRMLLKT